MSKFNEDGTLNKYCEEVELLEKAEYEYGSTPEVSYQEAGHSLMSPDGATSIVFSHGLSDTSF